MIIESLEEEVGIPAGLLPFAFDADPTGLLSQEVQGYRGPELCSGTRWGWRSTAKFSAAYPARIRL
jgi:hypothetical protein